MDQGPHEDAMAEDPREDPVDEDEVRERARMLLRSYGPLTSLELAQLLTDDSGEMPAADAGGAGDREVDDPGVDRLDPAELRRLLLDDRDEEAFAAFPLSDGRLCDLQAMIDGLTLTHVISDDERATGDLEIDEDLLVLHLLADDPTAITVATAPTTGSDAGSDARATATATLHDDRLELPDGWLPSEPVVAVELRAGRAILRGLPAPPPVDETVADRLAQTLEILREDRGGIDAIELLVESRARYPQLLRTVSAPLSQLLDATGLRSTPQGIRHRDEPDPADPVDELLEHLRDDHGFNNEESRAVLRVLEATNTLATEILRETLERLRNADRTDPLDELPRDAAATADLARHALEQVDLEETFDAFDRVLSDTELAAAVIEDVLDHQLDGRCLTVLLELAQRQLRLGTRQRANAAWLRAKALELFAADHAEVERALRTAVELDDDHAPATFALANYVADRGQAGAALGLLHRLEGPGVETLSELLAPYARPGPASAGRNDPCPCGSGRKHKVCCQQHGGWPLQDRIDWVWGKVLRFVGSATAEPTLGPLARVAGHDDPTEALDDVAVLNLALYEGGLLEELCDRRGSLLPADELALLREWSQVRVRAYEVVSVGPRSTITFLDLTSGDRASFTDHSLARQLDEGTAVLAWLVPEPQGLKPSQGVVRIPEPQRSNALELLDEDPDAFELASWYAALYAPPRIATTAGDPLVTTTQIYRTADPDAAFRDLSGHLEVEGDDTLVAHEERDGRRWLKGSVRVEDDRLHVETLSSRRARWFAELIAQVVPDAELIDEVRLPAGERGAGHADEEDDRPFLDLDALDPEARRELEGRFDTMMTEYEDGWVDTPIPRLGDRTPREAAADPTRRDDLLRLLDEVERHAEQWSSPGRPMDADRLRSLLGL